MFVYCLPFSKHSINLSYFYYFSSAEQEEKEIVRKKRSPHDLSLYFPSPRLSRNLQVDLIISLSLLLPSNAFPMYIPMDKSVLLFKPPCPLQGHGMSTLACLRVVRTKGSGP